MPINRRALRIAVLGLSVVGFSTSSVPAFAQADPQVNRQRLFAFHLRTQHQGYRAGRHGHFADKVQNELVVKS